MKTLTKDSSDADLVENLGRCDPVHDFTIVERIDKDDLRFEAPTRKRFVRRCALCGAVSGHNEENVTHQQHCPWIWAMRRRK